MKVRQWLQEFNVFTFVWRILIVMFIACIALPIAMYADYKFAAMCLGFYITAAGLGTFFFLLGQTSLADKSYQYQYPKEQIPDEVVEEKKAA